MGQYDFQQIEKKWQQLWLDKRTFQPEAGGSKPKYYILDMFPYPSGAGLHVGHPLGYIATDIVGRYKMLRGFNVLHPMGYDAFGLPAEQYAIETGTHPAVTTANNIATYQRQLSNLGLGFDPRSTDMKTCDPSYYKWTQWIFLQIFNSWYNLETEKAERIETLMQKFSSGGSAAVQAFHGSEKTFTAAEWNAMSPEEQHEETLHYRMAYIDFATVNWCPALGTVLANDEVINGVSERGGHEVIRKPMRQWMFRMTAYAERLLRGLDSLDWPEPIKEMQRNWIGRSEGASIRFTIAGRNETIEVFSTRPDTIFGATFMVLAPEHELAPRLATKDQVSAVISYIDQSKNRSELERMADTKKVSGVFTGSYAIHPFTNAEIPIWIADYVLGGYGTGAVMAVPAHDSRDYAFARHFGLEILEVVSGGDISKEAYEAKDGKLVNSSFLNGMRVKEAIQKAIAELKENGIGKGRVNYRLRDPNFSRQRYWGEPFPIVYRKGIPYAMKESELPVLLPDVDSYQPSGSGESPLANLKWWTQLEDGSVRETNTMPGYAGSSWYFLRYLSVDNEQQFVTPADEKYWMNVDLYVGGSEHAVGHLLYSRFWTQVLFDLGLVSVAEPFQKLVNQGMIQGRSSLAYRINGTNEFVSAGLASAYEVTPIHVDLKLVDNDVLDVDAFRAWRSDFADATFILEEGKYICGHAIEKMSKRYHNVINPDDLCSKYGADTYRLYEMFLGPLEMSKPFILNGIEGSHKFLRRIWNLFMDDQNQMALSDDAATKEELKVLHQTIRKTQEDIEKLSLHTAVAQFMIFSNEMARLNCRKRAVLEPFLIVLSPYAPHFCEELWSRLGHAESITRAQWPEWKEEFLTEDAFDYPVSVNGKVRLKMNLPLAMDIAAVEAAVRESEEVKKALGDKSLKKVIVVHGRIVNLVAG